MKRVVLVKTSTTALISWELSNMGYKVLMVDCDPQANLTDLMIKNKKSRKFQHHN
ncbi:ParA family protein [Lactiplantibacillus plantarum]|uniref:ParA family protein n=1 Tax=Lactiplantibacillus plantarum TaxID=1590 RepID=UPI00291677D1|nr:AAA family ATPase [Lactiplantibacillus plantarum]